jgi:hypothetical protein
LLDLIVYGTFIALLIFSFGFNILLIVKNKKLNQTGIKIALEKYTIAKKLEIALAENDSKKLEKDDGFIKFLSQSRESAFGYIEEVQEAIEKYSVDQTEENYQKLISFLPKKDEKR